MTTCDFLSGLFAGFTNLVVGHPFDTVKVNQQTQNTSLTVAIEKIYKLHGTRGFFRGLGFPLVSSGLTNAVFFGTYEGVINEFTAGEDLYHYMYVKDHTHEDLLAVKVYGKRQKTYMDAWIAGCAAGVTQTIVACPVEVVKINLQMAGEGGKRFSGPFSVVRHLLKTRGFKEFYRGVGAMMLRDVPASGVYMCGYAYLSDIILHHNLKRNIHEASMFQLFMAGGIAGTISWWSAVPVDVIKTKLQTVDSSPTSLQHKGILECGRHIMKTQGVPGFFVGFVALTLRAFPVNGATFLAYEWFSRFCRMVCGDPTGKCNRYMKFNPDPDADDPW